MVTNIEFSHTSSIVWVQRGAANSASCKSNVDAGTGALILQVWSPAKMKVNFSDGTL